MKHFCSLIKIISGIRQVSTLSSLFSRCSIVFQVLFSLLASNLQEVLFLKPGSVESEYRFYGFRSELQEEECCRPEPGLTPQLWWPICNERQPQRLCLQTGWGRATVSLCAVINIRRASFPEAISHCMKWMSFLWTWNWGDGGIQRCILLLFSFCCVSVLFGLMTCWNMKMLLVFLMGY